MSASIQRQRPSLNQDKKWEYWYMFGIGAPSGTLNEVHGRGAVSFGKASEWRWSGSFEYDGETRYRNLYVGMCCHVGDDLVEGEKKNQVSVLEKGDGYVVLGLAQTAAGTGLDDQAGATIIKVMCRD
ncbi:hypothetical protein C818_02604 [Lachnospiraceae bacterium MD308]|nr:hypothetical protein C818_02604 [Lachnospiraceae bacterium MD308]